MAKFAVVGAGLLGRFTALLLDKNGHQVHLYEQGALTAKDATGRLAAAMVAPAAESVIATENIVSMGRQALQIWPKLLQFLEMETELQQQGSIILAHRQDANDLAHFQQRLNHLQQNECSVLDRARLQSLEPELENHFHQALFLPTEGHIDNHQLYSELERKLQQSQLSVYQHTPVTITDNTVVSEQQTTPFDWVIDCRGMGAKANVLNGDNALRGVRGEVARVRAPEVNLTRPVRLMHPRYPIYIVPKADHHYVIGATEIESSDNKKPSVRSTLELLSAAYSVHKGFAEAELVDVQAGLRPTLLNNEPELYVKANQIQVNGLYRHGYLLTPSVLMLLLQTLQNHSVQLDTFADIELPLSGQWVKFHED